MASEVEKLKEKLQAETRANQMAAEFGLQLLEKNKSVQAAIQKQRTEHEHTVATLMQQVHTLTSKLDVTQQMLKDQAAELEMSKELSEKLKIKLINNESEHQRQLTKIEKTRNQLELECLERDNTISILKKNIQEMEIQIQDASNLQGNFSDTTDSFDQNLQLENQELQSKNCALECKLLTLEKELQSTRESAGEVESAYQQMQEELVYRNNKVADCMLQKSETQEELELLRSELESLKLGQLDVRKRGNSLFAEVEDNRKALENEVKTLRCQMKLMKEKDEASQHEIKRMTNQIAFLLNTSNQGTDTNYVQKLTQDLSQARGEIEELSLKLKLILEKQNSVSRIPSPVERVPKYKHEGYDFMNTLMEEKDRRIENLMSELQSVNFMKTSLNNRIVQTDQQLYLTEKKNNSLKAEIVKLKQNLYELKKEDSTFPTRNTPEIRMEKIPGLREKHINHESDVALGNLKVTCQTELLTDNKENMCTAVRNVSESQKTKDNVISKGIKGFTKQVSFAVDTKDDCEQATDIKPKAIGKRAEAPPVFVSSSDAVTPNECAQQ